MRNDESIAAHTAERPDLREPVREVWEANAAFWDEHMAEGNAFQRRLVGPATERLLHLQPGERVVEFACGNGVMSRRMARLGARVLATDVSAAMLERARARTAATELADRIEYRQVDASDEGQIAALGAGSFDAAVCNMAIMDMPEVAPLFAGARKLLKPGGRFVFSLLHPAFNSGPFRRIVAEEDIEGEIVTRYAIQVTDYVTPQVQRGLAARGQEKPQYYFHRPLSDLLEAAFRAGFALDGLEEPHFTPDDQGEADSPFSWEHFVGIPPVLAARLR